MATEVGTAYVRILPSTQGFSSALQGQATVAGTAGGKAAGKGFGSGMVAGAARFAGPLAAAFAGVQAFQFGKEAIAQASDLNESVNAVNVTFGKAARGVKRLGKEASDALGLSNDDFNALAVRFSNFAQTVAREDGRSVVNVLDELTTRAADFASVMNLEVADAAALFQSGLAGETEPLRRFGIDMSAAAVSAFAYSKGIAEEGDKLTEQQKILARYGLLISQTNKTQGDFANTSDQLANQQRILGARFTNLKATIGTALLPTVTQVVTAVNKLVGSFQGLAGDGRLASFGKTLTPILRDLGRAFSEFWVAAQPIIQRLKPLLEGIFDGIAARWQGFFQIVSGLLDTLTGILTGDTEKIKTGLTKVWDGIRTSIVGTVRGLIDGIAGVFRGIGPKIGGTVTSLGDRLGQWWSEAWRKALDAVVRGVEAIIVFVARLPGNILGALVRFPGQLRGWAVRTWGVVRQAAIDFLPRLLDFIKTIPDRVVENFGNLYDRMVEVGGSIVRGLVEGVKNLVPWLLEQAGSFASNFVDSIKDNLGISSPSKVMAQMGRYAAQGFVKGLDRPGDVSRAVARLTAPTMLPAQASGNAAALNRRGATDNSRRLTIAGDVTIVPPDPVDFWRQLDTLAVAQ